LTTALPASPLRAADTSPTTSPIPTTESRTWCAWETVTAIIIRAVVEWIDEQRREELYRIGVDEICYRHPNQYLTVIGNHDTGKVVGVEPDKSIASFTNFLDKQLDSTPNTVSVVSMDGSVAYRAAALERLPKASICFDPFHVMQWTNRALDAVFSDSRTLRTKVPMGSGQWRGARWALRRGKVRLTDAKHEVVKLISRSDRDIGHAWRLKEDLRDILRIERVNGARKALQRWIRSAARSKILPMIGVGATDTVSSRRYRGRDRTRRVERFDRGHQFEDPIDQCPWLQP
jgi:transposase